MNTLKLILLNIVLISAIGTVKAQSTNDSLQIKNTEKTYGKYGADSANCVKNLSLYREFYNQWKATKYTDPKIANQTLNAWRECFFGCPLSSKNMYIHGEKIINFQINKNKADSVIQQAYVDTLMMIFDQRMQYFGDDEANPAGVILGRKAQEYMKYRPEESKVYYPMFVKSFEEVGNESEAATLYYFYAATVRYVQQKNADNDLILENYIKIVDAIDYNQTKYANDDTKLSQYATVSKNLEKSIQSFATCEKLIAIYEPRLKADPQNLALAKTISTILEKRNCTSSDLYYNALAEVHAADPNAESAFAMGKMSLERKEYSKAKDYLTQAINSYPDSLSVKKASACMLLSETYRLLNQYGAARAAALKILEYTPNEGMAYIMIGDLYSSSASQVTIQGLRVAYWAAADKYAKAISISDNQKTKDLAQKKLSTIRNSFPVKQDLFMRSLTEGEKVTVEGWINEETTVRAK